MELQFSKNICDCLRRVVWETKTEELTQEIRLTDGMPDVGRILGAWGQLVIRSKEWRGNGMSLSGGITASVVYLSEEGETPHSVEIWIPFQLKWDVPDSRRDGTMVVCCSIKGIDARSVSARKLMARAVVSAAAEGLEPCSLDLYTPDQLPDDVQLLEHTYTLCLPKEAGEKVFVLDEELSFKGEHVEKVLTCCVHTEIIDQKLMGDKAVFRGIGALHMLTLCSDGDVRAWDFEIPFSQYAELDREYGSSAGLRLITAPTNLECELTHEGTVRVKAGLTGQYVIYDDMSVTLVEDAFSPVRTVELQRCEIDAAYVLDHKTEMLKVQQVIGESGYDAVELQFMYSQPEVRGEKDAVTVACSGMFQLVDRGTDDLLRCETVSWSMDHTLCADEETRVLALAEPTGKPQLRNTGEGAVAEQDMLLNMMTISQKQMNMVCGLVIGDPVELDADRPNLVVRRAGDNTLWDLAKAYGSTVQAICQANQLTNEPDSDMVLLIPMK